jgi:molybdopterin-guanine dinucleotide biosynthesis protein A
MAVRVAAFVIAGGLSSRMGRDKAFLQLDGRRTLLDRALALACRVSDQVKIVGQRDKFAAYGDVVEDVYPLQGPLAGIHAALSSSLSELNVMIGVDTPFLDARFLNYLVQQAEASGAVVTVPVTGSELPVAKTNPPQMNTDEHGSDLIHSDPPSSAKIRGSISGGKAQPLCAVYRRQFADLAEEALKKQRNNIVPLFARVTTRMIDDSELRKMGFDPIMFENVNTPEEWEVARKRNLKLEI